MLIGEYLGKITEKNRIALPKKIRNELEAQIVITRGYENCLIILDSARFEKLIRIVEQSPFLNKSVRDTKRFLVGGAQEINMDEQGRFVLTENQKKYAHLEKEVMFVGILDWVELWDLNRWEAKIKDLSESASEIAEKLGG